MGFNSGFKGLMWKISDDIRGSHSSVAVDLTLWDVTPYRLVSLLCPESDVILSKVRELFTVDTS